MPAVELSIPINPFTINVAITVVACGIFIVWSITREEVTGYLSVDVIGAFVTVALVLGLFGLWAGYVIAQVAQ